MPEPVSMGNIELPLYNCHKKVRAAKIIGVESEPVEPEDGMNPGAILKLQYEEGEGPTAQVFLPVVFAEWQWLERFAPEDQPLTNGYLVQYEDGYVSWSPAEAFEKGYTRDDGQDQPMEKVMAYRRGEMQGSARRLANDTLAYLLSTEAFDSSQANALIEARDILSRRPRLRVESTDSGLQAKYARLVELARCVIRQSVDVPINTDTTEGRLFLADLVQLEEAVRSEAS